MNKTVFGSTLLLVLTGASAMADGVGVRAGTDGIGADIAFSSWVPFPGASVRLGLSDLDYSKSVNNTNVNYDGKLKLQNGSLLLDWAPLGPFRLTGGLMFGSNKISITGQPTNGNYTFNGNNYAASSIGSVNGEIKAKNSVAPYLGVGYGTVAGLGVNFYTDLGVMLTGGVNANVSAACGAAMATAQCNQLQGDVKVEQNKLQNDVNVLKAYPIFRIGFTVGF